MATFFILFGSVSLIYGLLSVLGKTKNDISGDSALDKKLFSEENRYFMRRYYAGFKFIIAGLGAIALGVMTYIANDGL